LGYEPNELPLLHPAIFNLGTLKDTIAFNGNSQGYEPDELPLLHPAIYARSPECLHSIPYPDRKIKSFFHFPANFLYFFEKRPFPAE
ncbi:MAG: hypothetical protein IJZ13_03500, partial [Clostridia bacterium]|nr:hypothetical protein [Clostridia bacterium]